MSSDIEIRPDETGAPDDIVAREAEAVHLERMGPETWWLGVYMPDGRRLVVWLQGRRNYDHDVDDVVVEATAEVEPGPNGGRVLLAGGRDDRPVDGEMGET